jgi:hypothetical protein
MSSDDSANAGCKIIAMHDTNGGAGVDLSSGYICDGLSVKFACDGELQCCA